MNKKSRLLTILLTAVIVFALTTAFYLTDTGSAVFMNISHRAGSKAYFGKLSVIDNLIKNKYVGTYNPEKLIDRALHSYVDSLGDVYSAYLNKNEYEDLSSNLGGDYRGIGITVKATNEGILVTDVRKNTPAEKGGLKNGDIIKAVNGKEYSSSQLSDAVSAIKSTELGKVVKLGILRNGADMELDILVEEIKQEYVSGKMLDSSVGYIRITTFGSNIFSDFEKKVAELKGNGMKALILDFRSNPGGALESAVDIADYLLPEGKIITVRDKAGKEDVYTSDKKEIGIPMCVLINESSASASEVVAGALKDYNKATIVGKTSYGKGVVQSIYDLGDNTGLRITTASYFTPSGKSIQGTGVEPHIEVDLPKGVTFDPLDDNMQNDTQLNAALTQIKKQIK